MQQMFEMTKSGIYIPDADLYIDPWKPVKRCIITHAHSDHARIGNGSYLCHHYTKPILKYRLSADINCESIEYGEKVMINGVQFSLHPAAHIPGSAQIRIEKNGQVLVVSGDYKTEDDGLSGAFEVVKCNQFISESTFGLPIFKWKPQVEIFEEINNWWKNNIAQNKTSILIGYALGKAQRLVQNIDPKIGKVLLHGAVFNINEALINAGVALRNFDRLTPETPASEYKNALIIAPSSALGTPWIKKFHPFSVGYCSGWMQVRGNKRREAIDKGFVLSDHADWDQLNEVIQATGAEKVFITHGYTATFVKWLREKGMDAYELETDYTGEKVSGDDEININA